MKTTKVLLLSATLLSLTACGGGDDGGNSDSISGTSSLESSAESDAAIKDFVRETNYPNNLGVFNSNLTDEEIADWDDTPVSSFINLDVSMVRFGVNTQIPIYYVSADGSNPPQDIIDGIAKIEASLGDIYTDFTLVTADLSVYKDPNYPDENRAITGDGAFDITEFNTRFGALFTHRVRVFTPLIILRTLKICVQMPQLGRMKATLLLKSIH
jgi:hypothetical protein